MPVSDTREMIATMTPVLTRGRFRFVTDPAPGPEALAEAVATCREAEGLSLVLPDEAAARLGYADGPAMRRITLNVFSALEGIGLTAAVAAALTAARIPCNVVAGFHHDHVFVPDGDAERALAALKSLQERAARD